MHISLPGDVGKSKTGDVTSETGALAGADGSVVTCWKKTPCVAAAGGGACSGNDKPVLLIVAGPTEPETGWGGGA